MEQIECNIKTLRVDQTVCNEFRNVLKQHMTNKKTQELVKCNKDLLVQSHLMQLIKKSDDDFVFIPTDWQLKPNKLTDHQKEKMKHRKSDIPALYNDLSQSQDSISIKEWSAKTPISPSAHKAEMTPDSSAPIKCTTNKKPVSSSAAHTTEVIPDNNAPIKCTTLVTTSNSKLSKQNETEIFERRRANELKKLQIDAVFSKIVESEENQSNSSRSRRRTTSLKRYTDTIDSDKSDDNLNSKSKRSRDKPDDRSLAKKSNSKNTSDGKDTSVEVIESSQPLESQSVISGRKSLSRIRAKNVLSEKQQSATVRTPTNETIAQMDTMLDTEIDRISDQGQTLNIVDVTPNCKIAEMETETNCSELGKLIDLTGESFSVEPDNNTCGLPPTEKPNKAVEACEPTNNESLMETNCDESVSMKTDSINRACEEVTENVRTKSVNDILIATEHSIVQLKENDMCVNDVYNESTQPLPQSSDGNVVQMCDKQTGQPSNKEINKEHTELAATADAQLPAKETVDAIEKENENIIEEPVSPLVPIKVSSDVANQSILSSLNCSDIEDRNNELINNTMDISPILEAKSSIEPSNAVVAESPATLLIKKSSVCDVDSPTRKKLEPLLAKVPIESPKSRLTSTPMQSPCSSRVQFRGRAAQMLNLANIKRDNSPVPKRIQLSCVPDPKAGSATDTNQRSGSPELTYEELLARNKDLLTFSKELPSPYASPSFSILKRKFDHDDTFDDDLQANKRKRVSFHDPPVSTTKEFLRHVDENPPLRSAKDPIIYLEEYSHRELFNSKILKRKNRADSMVEIAKFSNANKLLRMENENLSSLSHTVTPLQMDSLNYDSIDDDVVLLDNDKVDDAMLAEQDISVTPSPMITFADKSAILQYVFEEYTLSQLFTKYTESERVIGPELNKLLQNEDVSRPLIRELSNVMAENTKMKSNVLEQLSNKHATEFLNHAVQENRSSDVLKRLTADSVVEYACEMLKTDENVTQLLVRGLSDVMTENPQIKSTVWSHITDKHPTELLNYAVQGNESTDILKRLTIDSVVEYVCAMMKTDDNVKDILMRNLTNVMTENSQIKSNVLEHFAKKYPSECLNQTWQQSKSSDVLDYVCNMVNTNDGIRQSLIEKLLLNADVKQTMLQQLCNTIDQPGNNHLPKAFSTFVLSVLGQKQKM